jgi:tetratricopeptide (TPR) repeat protein
VAALGESRTALEQALALFQEVGDATGHARALDLLSMVNGLEGRVRACGEYATEALRRFRALGDRAPEPSLVTNHGFWLVFAGERARAEPRVRDGLHAAVAVGSRSAEAYAHMALAETNEIYGDFGAALREADEAIAIARAIGHREWTAGALSIVGRVHRLCGDPAGAAVSHEEMLAIDRALGSVLWMAEALGELGLDALEVGDTERGAALMREAIATAPEAMKSIVRYLVALAELALQQGDPSGAVAQARDVQARVPEFRVFIVDAVRVEGEALVALGQEDLGEGTLRRAQIEAITMNAAPATWRACLALASVLERAGRIDEARAERAAARGALDRAARDLPHSLGASFAQSAVVRRAERS